MTGQEVGDDGLWTKDGEGSLYWCTKHVMFAKDRKGMRRLRECEHSASGVVVEQWITSCLHCAQVSKSIDYVICMRESHFWNGGYGDLGVCTIVVGCGCWRWRCEVCLVVISYGLDWIDICNWSGCVIVLLSLWCICCERACLIRMCSFVQGNPDICIK